MMILWTALLILPNAFSLPAVTLRDVVEDHLLGIHREPKDKVDALMLSAKKYLDYKKGTLSGKDWDDWQASCKTKAGFEKDDVCLLVLGKEPGEPPAPEDDDGDKEGQSIESLLAANLTSGVVTAQSVAKAYLEADWGTLRSVKGNILYQGLKRITDLSRLKNIRHTLLSKSSRAVCDSPGVPTALAQKLEMGLPIEVKVADILPIYELTLKCDPEDIVYRAWFRLGLLRVSRGEWKQASEVFQKLSDAGGVQDLGSRVYYWLARSAEATGDLVKFNFYKQRMLKEYPLSYHTVLLNKNSLASVSRVMAVGEPTVLLRSLKELEINRWIRLLEAFAVLDAGGVSRRLFVRSMPAWMKVEPRLRLYLSVVGDHIGDPISQFRLLTSVFRDDPTLMTQNTLRRFYPLKNMEVVRRFSGPLDPFFFVSLIRQESGFNPSALSPVGAIGLMQLMPQSARVFERVSRSVLFQPNANIRIGTKLMGRLLERFDRDAELALAAYNAGPERVNDWKKRYSTEDRMLFLDLIPYKETRDYVALIARNYFWYHNLYGERLGVPEIGRSLAQASSRSTPTLIFSLFQ